MECENCGAQVAKSQYKRDIHGTTHVFCTPRCADEYELRTTGHLHH